MAMLKLLGGAVPIVAFLVASGSVIADRSTNYVSVDAEVFRIDRLCGFNTSETVNGKVVKTEKTRKSCNTTDEFSKIRQNPDSPSMRVDGESTVHVVFTSPLDQTQHTSTLQFNGEDREFYALKAHDKIKILVNKKDPNKITQ
jgi:hypothetical protein